MFPPKKTADPEQMFARLYESVRRGGEAFDRGRSQNLGNEILTVFYLGAGALSKEVREPLGAYIRQYVRASGWRLTKYRLTKNYLEMRVSNAASSLSRKP